MVQICIFCISLNVLACNQIVHLFLERFGLKFEGVLDGFNRLEKQMFVAHLLSTFHDTHDRGVDDIGSRIVDLPLRRFVLSHLVGISQLLANPTEQSNTIKKGDVPSLGPESC